MSASSTLTNLGLLALVENRSALPTVQISAATIARVQSTRISYQGCVICLTQQLAQFYGCDPEHILEKPRKNSDRFEKRAHFVRLDGEALKVFKEGLRNWLHDEKILYRLAGVLTPYQRHINAGRFTIKTGISQVGKHSSPLRGVEWIACLWMQHQARLKQGMEVAA